MTKAFCVLLTLVGTLFMISSTGLAQVTDDTDEEEIIQLLQRDLRSERKELIEANLPLTDEEARRSWPIFQR